jgi:hypothetical protein
MPFKIKIMKKIQLLLLTLLIPFLGYTQGSWINIQLLTDDYPTETSWQITPPGGSPIIIQNDSAMLPNTLYDTTIAIGGTIVTSIFDQYGDGLGASQWNGTDGWFLIQNDCQDTIMYVAGDFGVSYIDTLNIAPCAPPAGGCLDQLATNYDSTAAFDNGSCIYPPCNGLDTFYVENYCDGPQNKVHYKWTDMANPNCRMAAYTRSTDLYSLGSQWYPYPGNFSNTGILFSNSQNNTTYYFLGMLADSSYTDTLIVTTQECIPGCTDPTALNYNPWANSDDGSCQAPPANCATGESNIVVSVIPDTYPGETSWEIADTTGNILATSPAYSITGVPVITEVCIPNGTVIEFTLFDSFGDGLCGSCYGGADGGAVVQTLCGDTIMAILPGNANFGDDTSVVYTVAPCVPNVIYGCTTPGFTEYNSLATVDDSTCLTPIILGCVDPTSPDYDPSANTMDIIPNCNYTLVITDAAQDGWFGAWLGVLQDTTTFGPFMMGPLDGASESFTISLSALSPVNIMFFAPGNSSTTSQQCGFYLISPEGDTTLSGGTNAWLDPMIQFPYKYKETPNCGDYCTDGIVGCMDPMAFNYNNSANMPDICIPVVLGCTNDLAFNYDSLANTDDNSCVPEVIGCMDSTAFNFSSAANTNDPLSCVPVIIGCMDATMFNYNAAANTTNNNCIPVVYGCIDSTAFNFNIAANTNNGSCISITLGCIDPTQFNFNSLANVDDGTCLPYIYGCTDSTAFNYDALANTNVGCVSFYYGCTDATQFNYDPLANTDDGSCVPFILGCNDPTALNYDSTANVNTGCVYPLLGCTNPISFNFNVNANVDDGSCIPYIYGCTDATAINYDSLANTNVGCIYPFFGCTDPIAFNFNVNANTDDGSCVPFIYGCTNNLATNYDPTANTDNGSCILPAFGCTDQTMFNYDPTANVDDGSCIPFIYGCMDNTAFNFNSLANTDNGSCIAVVNGCTDSLAFNYIPSANTDNGSCIPFIYGCTDITALNFDPLSNTLDNSCCYIGGCTDATAINYNPNACQDDGSCIVPIIGCTDVGAYNYNPSANVSDTTACNYDAGCYGGPGVPYWLNDPCYAWVIDVDNSCCTDNWDNYCVNLYNYCLDGMPTSIEDLLRENDFVIYPNPTKDIINLAYNKNAKINLYGPLGVLMASGDNIKQIDLSAYSNGIYVLYISYDNKIITHKIVKQ